MRFVSHLSRFSLLNVQDLYAEPYNLCLLNKNGIRTDLRYIAIDMTKPYPWYVSNTGYDEIVSIQQNYFGFLKFKTSEGKIDFAFSCTDNNAIIKGLIKNGLDSSKFLPAKIIPKYIQFLAVAATAAMVIGMIYVFISRLLVN